MNEESTDKTFPYIYEIDQMRERAKFYRREVHKRLGNEEAASFIYYTSMMLLDGLFREFEPSERDKAVDYCFMAMRKTLKESLSIDPYKRMF